MSLSLCFGPFELHPERRQLLERGEPVHLGGRALELLIALTERAGELLSRGELESRLWPRTIVEETSLRVHVSALRKVLGEGVDGTRYIANVPGRGYSFVAPIERVSGRPGPPDEVWPAASCHAHNLPGRISRVIGREEAAAALAADLRTARLVSLVGAGGMGKTTVAVLVATHSLPGYADGVRFVDFSPIAAGGEALSALADALALQVDDADPWASVLRHLRERRMLLVLDNCEHVIQSAAELAERLLIEAPQVRILATSREPLDVQGERVHRLAGLQVPAESEVLSLERATGLPAIQLFAERAAANTAAFELDARRLPHVRRICHRLDGIPLAIELAAARVDTLGVEGLAVRLDHMFDVLTRGRRTAFPRHRTLQALLEWSHDLLAEPERIVLRRLSMCRAAFSLEFATQLCRDAHLGTAGVIDAVLGLTAKSLIAVDRRGDAVQYRLLYTTRTYAEQKLVAAGEREAWSRRHAQCLSELLEADEAEEGGDTSPWAGEFAQMHEDVQVALDWTLTPGGDAMLGAELAYNAFRFYQRGGPVRDMRARVQRLLEKLRALSPPQPQLELRLQTSLSFLAPTPNDGPQAPLHADRTLALAEQVGGDGDRIEAQYGLCLNALGQADYAAALARAGSIRELAVGSFEDLSVVLADRLEVFCRHYRGEHAAALSLARRVLDHRLAAPVEPRFGSLVPYSLSMGWVLACTGWLQGRAQEAQERSEALLAAAATEAPLVLCQMIGHCALPIALWRGELEAATGLHERLREHAAHIQNLHWISWAGMFERALLARRASAAGSTVEGDASGSDAELDMLVTLVPAWAGARALQRAENGAVGWSAPETLRAAAQNLLDTGRADVLTEAERLLLRAERLATGQGALAWQLRIAGSLANLRHRQGRTAEGCRQLEQTLGRFTEGLDDADPRAARQLLAALAA